MEKKSIKLKTRFIISVSFGVIALIVGFWLSWCSPSGDTPEKITEVESEIENLLGDASKEIRKEQVIAELIRRGKEVPAGNLSQQARQELATLTIQKRKYELINAWEMIETITESLVYHNKRIAKAKALSHYQENPIPEISWDKYLWENQNEISQEDWAIQTLNSRISTSIGITALSFLGCIIGIFLLLIIANWLWYFLLHRISELSQAIQGK